jgi:GNAT superfamily N-acetyltransferase
VDTRTIDLDDTEEFRRCYEIMREAELFERPSAPMWSEHEMRVMFTREDPAERMTAYGSFNSGAMVAMGFTSLSLLDNLDKAFVHVAVPPALRRRGIGSALLHDLVDTSRTAGRSVLITQAWVPPGQRKAHPHRAFAEKNQFSLANVEVRRVLPLPVAQDRLDAWAAEAADHHHGYTIESFVDDIPDELLGSFCEVMNQLALDAPTGDIDMEAEAITPEVYRQRQAITKEQGRTVYVTLALDASRTTVAYTAMAVPADEPLIAHQWGTLVHRDHRGHRLGLAVKSANLAVVQAKCPDRTLVSTQNGEVNGPMIQINERMGFRPVEELTEFQRVIAVGGPA